LTFARTAGLLVVVLAVALALWPEAVGLDRAVAPTAALVFLALGFWATGALPFHLTGLGLFVLAMVFRIAPPAVVFAGFASAALWLVFGGLVIGAAVQTTGLGRRLARLLVGHLSGSYRRIVYGTVGLGTALAFLVPAAMGRVMILMPIFAALAGELGFGRGRPGRTGILLAVAFGTILPAFAILPANLPNMVLLGVAETLYGVSPSYGAYLLLHFPVLGLLYGLLLAELICRLFPDRASERSGVAPEPLPPWSWAERRLLAVLVIALALWRPIRCTASRRAGSR
jgi:di/tricarboxylate transporter